MKRSGGGFDASYSAHTAVDDTAHIIVAAQVGRRRPTRAHAPDRANQHRGAPRQALADAGYGSEKNFEDLPDSSTDIVAAMGREGKRCAQIKSLTQPHTAAMPAKLQTPEGRGAYQRRK